MSTSHNNNVVLPTAIALLLLVVVGLMFMLVNAKSSNVHSGSQPHLQAANNSEVIGEAYNWKLVTSWPKNFPGLGTAPEEFAQLVNTMTRGRLNIKVYGANELVPAMGVFGAVSSGGAEMGHTAAYFWRGKIPAAVFFTSVPFGMNAQELNGWLHHGGGLELWRDMYAEHNLVPFAAGNTGVQMGGWFNREINSLADLKGLKMRIPGIGGDVFTRAGGEAVNIPGGELYTSLQSGVIDATEWVAPYNDLAFGFQQIAKYYYYPGWHEPGSTLELIVNKQAYDNLPEDLQVIIETAIRRVNQNMLDEFTARNNDALIELLNKHQVQLRRFPDDVLAEFAAMSQQIYGELAQNDSLFAKVHDEYMAYLRSVRNYHQLSEQAYFEARDKALPINPSH